MIATRATGLLQGLAFGLLLTTATTRLEARPIVLPRNGVRLFRVVTMQEDVLVGLTPEELALLGSGPEVERLARRIATEGQLTAWRYVVARGSDGSMRLVARHRVAVLRQDALMVEPYAAALPVSPPPVE